MGWKFWKKKVVVAELGASRPLPLSAEDTLHDSNDALAIVRQKRIVEVVDDYEVWKYLLRVSGHLEKNQLQETRRILMCEQERWIANEAIRD